MSSPGLAKITGDPKADPRLDRILRRLGNPNLVVTNDGVFINTDGKIAVRPGKALTPIVNKSATYTVSEDDFVINCTSGTFTVNLLTAVGRAGRVWVFKNSGVGTITVDASGAQTIDGSLTKVLAAGEKVWVQSDGTNFIVVG